MGVMKDKTFWQKNPKLYQEVRLLAMFMKQSFWVTSKIGVYISIMLPFS